MLTPSVNIVQSAFPENQQGEISGLSRCVSNLGSSLGTAVAGTILVAGLDKGAYAAAMIVLGRPRRSADSEPRFCYRGNQHRRPENCVRAVDRHT